MNVYFYFDVYIPSPCQEERKDFQYFERVAFKILSASIRCFARGARRVAGSQKPVVPAQLPLKDRANGTERFDSAEGKGPMYLHDPRSADLTPRHLRAEPISTDPLADVSATTQNGIDTCLLGFQPSAS